jgi:DeoR/GlpR family transcriptional regulator of sugar metabolism
MTDNRAIVPEQRRRRIAGLVRESGSTTVAMLEVEFGISSATARRDLATLERQGKIRRTHGGAVLPGLTQHEDSFQQRLTEAVPAKRRLAQAALALLEEDETVFVDSSTTAYYAAQRVLASVPRVTLLTNLVPVMELFNALDSPDAKLIGMGGSFRGLTLSFVGPCTVRMVESFLADKVFFSVRGVTPEGYLTDSNPLEAEVKRVMVRQAARPVLLVDGRKFERRGLSVITHVSEVALVLTADAHRSRVETLVESGVEVQCV